jgi:hypothetical protein
MFFVRRVKREAVNTLCKVMDGKLFRIPDFKGERNVPWMA